SVLPKQREQPNDRRWYSKRPKQTASAKSHLSLLCKVRVNGAVELLFRASRLGGASNESIHPMLPVLAVKEDRNGYRSKRDRHPDRQRQGGRHRGLWR